MIPNNSSTIQNNAGDRKKKSYAILGIGFFLFLALIHNLVGAFSINFFTTLDNTLKISEQISPIVMWGILGLLIGAVVGSLVIWKKYNLEFKWNFISIGVLTLFVFTLVATSSPLGRAVSAGVEQSAEATNLVEVSSDFSLPAYQNFTYDAANLLDPLSSTSWMFLHQDGRGESVNYVFTSEKVGETKNLKVNGIRVMNGFNKSHAKWNTFNRIKDFTVYHNGSTIYEGMAADLYNDNQTLKFNPVDIKVGDTIRLRVNSVYRINKKMDITAVSSMVPMILYTVPH